jgi:hypothetical protein
VSASPKTSVGAIIFYEHGATHGPLGQWMGGRATTRATVPGRINREFMAPALQYGGRMAGTPPGSPVMNASLAPVLAAGVVAVACTLAAPASQAASDYKFVAPVDCEPYAPNTLASELQYTPTGIYNPGTGVERVLCPIPRDQDEQYITNDVQVVAYYRGLGGAAAGMTCTLFIGSTSMQSTAVYAASVAGAPVASGARDSLIINAGSQTQDFAAVPVHVICALGPKVSFAGLFWDEAGPTHTP